MTRINYVIASYSGFIPSRHPSESYCLQRQFDYLISLKYDLVSQITVICPPPKNPSQVYPEYYQKEKWIPLFAEKGIHLVFEDYVGENRHHSYDQWLIGYQKYPDFDFYIFMEDDYYVEEDDFDKILLDTMRDKIPHDDGLMCTWIDTRKGPRKYKLISISNCIVSRRALYKIEKQSGDIVACLKKSTGHVPQVKFSVLFHNYNIPVCDYSDRFNALFWASCAKRLIHYNMPAWDYPKTIIVPFQKHDYGNTIINYFTKDKPIQFSDDELRKKNIEAPFWSTERPQIISNIPMGIPIYKPIPFSRPPLEGNGNTKRYLPGGKQRTPERRPGDPQKWKPKPVIVKPPRKKDRDKPAEHPRNNHIITKQPVIKSPPKAIPRHKKLEFKKKQKKIEPPKTRINRPVGGAKIKVEEDEEILYGPIPEGIDVFSCIKVTPPQALPKDLRVSRLEVPRAKLPLVK